MKEGNQEVGGKRGTENTHTHHVVLETRDYQQQQQQCCHTKERTPSPKKKPKNETLATTTTTAHLSLA